MKTKEIHISKVVKFKANWNKLEEGLKDDQLENQDDDPEEDKVISLPKKKAKYPPSQ